MYFNPHSPRRLWLKLIQIHLRSMYFNPHSPRRLWPSCDVLSATASAISIHTALAGCDTVMGIYMMTSPYFNPHSPRRLWRISSPILNSLSSFQSTQPSQAVTFVSSVYHWLAYISIHTALAGCDNCRHSFGPSDGEFQSTQPSQAVTWNN